MPHGAKRDDALLTTRLIGQKLEDLINEEKSVERQSVYAWIQGNFVVPIFGLHIAKALTDFKNLFNNPFDELDEKPQKETDLPPGSEIPF